MYRYGTVKTYVYSSRLETKHEARVMSHHVESVVEGPQLLDPFSMITLKMDVTASSGRRSLMRVKVSKYAGVLQRKAQLALSVFHKEDLL